MEQTPEAILASVRRYYIFRDSLLETHNAIIAI